MAPGGLHCFLRTAKLLRFELEWLTAKEADLSAPTPEIKGLLWNSCPLVDRVFVISVKPHTGNLLKEQHFVSHTQNKLAEIVAHVLPVLKLLEAKGWQPTKVTSLKIQKRNPKWVVRISSDQTCTLKNNVKQPKGIYFSGLQAKARLRIGGGGQTARAKPGAESIPLLDGVSEWKRKCLWSLFSLSVCRVIPDVSSSMAHQSLKGSHFFRTDLLLCPPSLSTIHRTPARSLGVGRCRLSAHASDHLSGPSSVSPRLKLPCFLYSD